MSVERVDLVVIGAGVVGLACARSLAAAGREVLVLESADEVGAGISARSSEVLHAGIYYPPRSRKARWCVAGRRELLSFCSDRGVAVRHPGKLIVATSEGQRPQLDALLANAHAAGATQVRAISAAHATALEPALRCTAALWSPGTAIVDSHRLVRELRSDAERAGALVLLRAEVTDGVSCSDAVTVRLADGTHLTAGTVVNAAGLGAVRLARSVRGVDLGRLPTGRFAKGSYAALRGPAPFARLVYPLPEPGGLGVHLTLDLAGRARFGPDVEWLDPPAGPVEGGPRRRTQDDGADSRGLDYAVDPERIAAFYPAARRYWPGLPDGALHPDYAGIRPKISGPGEPTADFWLDGPQIHGIPGWFNLLGIESPGLTAAFAIGRAVAAAVHTGDLGQ